ncbi:hypothetical protein [Paraflavitalea pollutisoli]|uniref:hypothetical protein n=1 Tax=Paraflavitalea pollutisoli TaxID=3034143 RepID=UPI0023EA9806|nr:hypothetical protein [Paraflavitalea sp. H1-2-19X]
MKRKPYTTPVWWLSIILFLKSALTAVVIVAFWQMSRTDRLNTGASQQLIRAQWISLGGYFIILFSEVIIYWRLRYYQLNRRLIWGHLTGWIIAIIGMPLLYAIATIWVSSQFPAEKVQSGLATLTSIQVGVMWGVLIIGHLCFVLVLVDAYKKKNHPEQNTDDDAENFLNDYNA